MISGVISSPGEITGMLRLSDGSKIRRRCTDDGPNPPERPGKKSGVCELADSNHDVQPFINDGRRRIGHNGLDRDVRMLFEKRSQRAQHSHAQCGVETDAQRASRPDVSAAGGALGVFQALQQCSALLVVDLTFVSERESPRRTIQQTEAELFFQGGQGLAQRGGDNSERLSGRREALRFNGAAKKCDRA